MSLGPLRTYDAQQEFEHFWAQVVKQTHAPIVFDWFRGKELAALIFNRAFLSNYTIMLTAKVLDRAYANETDHRAFTTMLSLAPDRAPETMQLLSDFAYGRLWPATSRQ